MTATVTTPTVSIDQVQTVDGVNPRTAADAYSDEQFTELVASITRHGVLQPILVRDLGTIDGKATYGLVAGSRRLAAAKKAGEQEIPITLLIGDDEGQTAALVENVQRKDLTPLEEAEAVQQLRDQLPEKDRKKPTKAVATALGKSEDWVQKRLQLLELPDIAKEQLALGKIGLHAVPVVARVAKASPVLAAKMVELVTSGESDAYRASDLADPDYFPDILSEAEDQAADDVEVVRVNQSTEFSDLPLTEEALAELQPLFDALPDTYSPGIRPAILLDRDDGDAAKAYGAAIEVENGAYGGEPAVYIADQAFIADRVKLKLEDLAAKAKKGEHPFYSARGTSTAAGGGSSVEPKADEPGARDESAAEAKRERDRVKERERKQREEAHAQNLDLGRRTAEKLREPEITADMARLIVTFAIRGTQLPVFAAQRFTDERWQTEETTKAGHPKRSYDATAIDAHVAEQLAKAKTAGEVFGLFMRGVITTKVADQEVVAQSNRSGNYLGHGVDEQLLDIALDLDVLPAAVKADVKEKRRKERQAEKERAEKRQNRVLSEVVAAGESMEYEDLLAACGRGKPGEASWRDRPEQEHLVGFVSQDEFGPALGALQRAKLVAKSGTGKRARYKATKAGEKAITDLATAEAA